MVITQVGQLESYKHSNGVTNAVIGSFEQKQKKCQNFYYKTSPKSRPIISKVAQKTATHNPLKNPATASQK